jgi:hypothetical protein
VHAKRRVDVVDDLRRERAGRLARLSLVATPREVGRSPFAMRLIPARRSSRCQPVPIDPQLHPPRLLLLPLLPPLRLLLLRLDLVCAITTSG